ncbi:MAG: 23S rRNA (guanosine(2251)-2'-O)-methyltransferase RlmB [Deltaproteobacteria bacterium]|nr:23S rRNA (guanosine(2251)-2'-O)-methyltransferase RlmB [Deltaproteobacteria bacterium]
MERNPRKKGHDCKPRKVYGLHAVQEHLRALPRTVQELYLLPSLKGTPVEHLAREAGIPVRYETQTFFDVFAQGGVHQGIAALLRPFPYVSLQAILEKEADLLLVLDGILDPRNLGALLRTAEAAGVGGVILTKDRSAPLSPLAEKTAAGATAYLSICRVENLARALVSVREAGYWLVGLAPDAEQTLYDLDLSRRIALLLGGEGKGLRSLTRRKCDCLVAIPMLGRIKSLNVSAACAVSLYEFLRRRRPSEL